MLLQVCVNFIALLRIPFLSFFYFEATLGRPRLDGLQPELMDAILMIVNRSSSADDRRRTENLRSVTTLTDLQKELDTLGFEISRSALYLRLLPRPITQRREDDTRKLFQSSSSSRRTTNTNITMTRAFVSKQ